MPKSIIILAVLCVCSALLGCTRQESRSTPEEGIAETEAPASSVATDDSLRSESDRYDTILFFGDSITAGYGLDVTEAYPALIQQKIDALGWPFKVINAGLSGDTSTGGLSRIDWLLREPFDVFVLELGGNDGLRGISLDLTRDNLQTIIDRVRAHNPDVSIIIAGMQIPPNLGEDYTGAFREVFPSLAEANEVHLIPFILQDVGGVPELNMPDGIHPTAEGHEVVAQNVWRVLKPVLEMRMEAMDDCAAEENIIAEADEGCAIDFESF